MAIRNDNTPPSKTPGSITKTADAQQSRIGNISNVSKTISNMQKDVKQRISETKESIDNSKEISAIQSSMVKVLDKLGETVKTLSSGVKKVTIDTAKATKDAIGDYGKAISEDISFNKQNVVAMALSKSTPIYGYFVAKFMETDVFKRAADRMKQSIGKVFGSLASVFRRDGKKPSVFRRDGKKPSRDQLSRQVKSKIPHMATGGIVGKEGVAKLHAAEVVMPINKLLSRMDDSNNATKNIGRIISKLTLQHAASTKAVSSMILHQDDRGDKRKLGLFKDFFKILREEKERHRDSIEVRQLRELIAMRETLGAKLNLWPEVWSRLLTNHPMFRSVVILMKTYTSLMKLIAWKPIYTIFKSRGGHARHLSRKHAPLESLNQNLGLLYVESMWRFDNMLNLLKGIAIATRATASKITGKKFDRLKGISTGEWSVAGISMKGAGLLVGGAMQLAGKIPGLRSIERLGKSLTQKSLTGRRSKKYSIDSADYRLDDLKKLNKTTIYVDVHTIAEKVIAWDKLRIKKSPKTEKRAQLMLEYSSNQSNVLKKVHKAIKSKSWIQWILIGLGFVKSMLTSWWKKTFGTILNKKVIGGLVQSLGGMVKGKAGMRALGIASGGAMIGYDAYKSVQMAEQWKTSKTSAGIGGALGGTGQGAEGAMKGAAKGGMMGAAIGSVFPGPGTIIGGGIGAIAGGVLGFIGGKRIASGLDYIGKKLKPFIIIVKDIIMLPFKFIKDSLNIFKDGLSWSALKKLTLKYLKFTWSMMTLPARTIWKLAKMFAPNLTTRITNMYDTTVGILKKYLVDIPIKFFKDLGTKTAEMISWPWKKLKNTYSSIMKSVDEFFSFNTLNKAIKGIVVDYPIWILKKIGSTFYRLGDLVFDMEALTQDVRNVINWPANKIKSIWHFITSWTSEYINLEKIKKTMMKPIDKFIGVFGWLGNLFTRFKNYIVNKISSIPGMGFFIKKTGGLPDKSEPAKIKAKVVSMPISDTAIKEASKITTTMDKIHQYSDPEKLKTMVASAIPSKITTTMDRIRQYSDPKKLKTMVASAIPSIIKDRTIFGMNTGQIVVNEAKLMLANGELIADDLGKKIIETSKDLGDKSIAGTKAVINSVSTISTSNVNQTNTTIRNGSNSNNDPSAYFDQLVFAGNYR